MALIFVIVPFIGMFVQVRWSDLGTLLAGEAAQDALWLSIRTTVISTVLSLVMGVPLAHIIAHQGTGSSKESWIGRTLKVLVTLPMVLPPVVAGLALLITFGRRGLVGKYLHVAGIDIGFTTVAVVMAQVFVAMPFLVVSLEGALRTRGNDLEKTALNLGASRSRVFFEITLPLTLPAVVSGTALTFARALGEFGATITFAGSLQGVTRTLPLEIYVQREIDTDTALALSVVLLVVAAIVIALTSFASAFSKQRLESQEANEHEDALGESPLQTITKLKKLDVDDEVCASNPNAVEVRGGLSDRDVQVDADIKKDCITALVGPNGAGKTTVLEMIAGTLTPDEGKVSTSFSGAATIVWLEQRAHLFPHMKVIDNVAFGPRARGVGKAEAHKRALAELEAVGCMHLKDRGPTQLSGGQAQRVAIARALAVDPDLVLLDEPFAAVDSKIAWSLRLVLRQRVREAKATAVLVTHDMVDTTMMADRIIVLEEGRTVEQGPTSKVLQKPTSNFLINLTGANRIAAGTRAGVVRPENLIVAVQDYEASSADELVAEGTVVQMVFMPYGEQAIVKLDTGEMITVAVNAYNRDLVATGGRIKLRAPEVVPTVR
ncbi:MAG: ABC transporter permease [Actinomycetaceae bacterium]|nr:ABC transporter permease [Actinomycetaceae bacterium]